MRTSTNVTASDRMNEVERFDDMAPTTTSEDYIKHDGTDNVRATGVVSSDVSSTTDNYVARASGTTGKLINFSPIIADDGGSLGFEDLQGPNWPGLTGVPYIYADSGTGTLFLDYSGTAAGKIWAVCGSGGTVTIGPATPAGLVGSDVNIAIKAGSSSGRIAKAGGTIYATATTANNGTTVETDLWSQSIAANVLATNLDCLRFRYAGSTAANVNTKQIRVKFGATTLFDSTAQAVNGQDWLIEGWIIRTSATTQKTACWLLNAPLTLWTFANYGTAAETLSGAVVLKITGQSGTASNDITFEMGKILWEPAP